MKFHLKTKSVLCLILRVSETLELFIEMGNKVRETLSVIDVIINNRNGLSPEEVQCLWESNLSEGSNCKSSFIGSDFHDQVKQNEIKLTEFLKFSK